MEDKRPIVYPSLLFGILFILISITGYFQIRITQNNMENLLINEGEILFKNIKREIEINLEYLDLLDKSPSLITPSYLSLMVFDEAIVEDLYNVLHAPGGLNPEILPFSNVLVIDGKGNTVFKRGAVSIPAVYRERLSSEQQGTVVRMPTTGDRSLLMGVKRKDLTLFLVLTEHELAGMRKRLVVQSIFDREPRSFNIVGTTLYDPENRPYAFVSGKKGKTFTIHRPLESRFLPGYSLEILISRAPSDSALRRTAISFMVMLFLLAIAGAVSTFAIFLLERRHSRKMKEIEKDLDLKERLVSLGRLASGMAHEIKNPLNAISMSAQRLKREFAPEKDKEEYYRFIDIMRAELLRVNRIVEEFLLSTRSHVPFLNENLYTIVDEIVLVLTEKARSQNIRLANKVDATTTLDCQKERLKQALYNLIVNGMEAVKADGTVELFSEVKGKNVELSVKDSGPGIKTENLHSIFEYYYTTKDKGMGLGLPISYMIIKDHGGDVKAVSEEGKGAVFVVTLPLAHTATEPASGKENVQQNTQ